MLADRLERAATAVLAAAALALTFTAVRRQLVQPGQPPGAAQARPFPRTSWQDALAVGTSIGNPSAATKIVVFSDLECPACRDYHEEILRPLLRDYQKQLSVVFVHFPLHIHRFAMQAARAAECARKVGRFAAFVDAVYDQQDSIGTKSWSSFAADAGIQDTTAIRKCAADTAPVQRIDAGRKLGLEWDVRGTPSVLVNGLQYDVPPGRDDIISAIAKRH